MTKSLSAKPGIAMAIALTVCLAACKGGSTAGGTGGGGGGQSSDTSVDGVCGTCASVYVNGGIPCGPSSASDAYDALMLCACGDGACAAACDGTLCVNAPADETCGECLLASCKAQEMTCADN